MAFEFFEVDSSTLAASKHCRLDQKYTSFTQIKDWKVFETSLKQLKLSNFLEELPIKKYAKGELEDGFYLVNISDQQQRYGELENVEIVDEIGSDKNCLSGADIIISKLGMPKGYIFLNTFKDKDVLGSTEFIPYKIRDQKFAIYLKYILLHPKSLKAYEALESGKTPSHKRVNPYEFLKIQIPLPTNPNQIVAQIEPIERKIKDLRSQIKKPQEVINKVFAREFGFDLEGFEELKKEKFFYTDLTSVAKNQELRFSVKHSLYSLNLIKILGNGSFLKFGKLLLEQPQYGANESGKDYSEGDVRYVRITDIDDIGNILNDDIKTAEKVEEKYLLKNSDFLFARSGNTVGKSFLYNSEIHEKAIFAGYFIKFVFDTSRLEPLFLLYHSKSFLFEVWKNSVVRTMGQPNINAEEYKTLPIPNLPLSHQQKIVDEIKLELDAQEIIKKQIESERQKIDAVIEQAISLRG